MNKNISCDYTFAFDQWQRYDQIFLKEIQCEINEEQQIYKKLKQALKDVWSNYSITHTKD